MLIEGETEAEAMSYWGSGAKFSYYFHKLSYIPVL